VQPGMSTAQVVIKFATLVPEGTSWMTLMEEMNDNVRRQTDGQVSFRFYTGGVAGDEREVIRKMRLNRLQGGAFSGFGLGEILSAVRVLELPLLFRDAAEASHVAGALFDYFATRFARQGYVLLSLDEAGPVYVFSQHPLRSRSDFMRVKMWTWQGDPLLLALFKAYGITPIPSALPEVLPSLRSGRIDACYGPPLGVLALQWFTKVKYYSTLPLTHAMGAMVLSERLWQQLTPSQQTVIRDTVRKYHAKATMTMREQHRKALTLLQQFGIEPVAPEEQEVARFQQVGIQVREDLAGRLYSSALLERVLQLREQYRREHR
jgi:TRAP-type C4-dicarboxylate transport system substrate-binding protein